MKKLSLLLLLGLMIVGCATTGANNRLVMQDSFMQGKQAYEEHDYAKAFSLLKPAAEAGNPNAQYYLAILYDFGRGTKVNHEEANMWYLKSAQQGNDDAQYNLAISYRRGEGIEQDEHKTVYWLSKSAANGDADAMSVLTDYAQDAEFSDAQYALACIYRDGVKLTGDLTLNPNERDNQNIAPDAEQYKFWLQKAAESGNPEAIKELR